MRVAVVGGTRFIGFAITRELAAAGHEVCVVHRGQSEPEDLPDVRHLHVARDELPGVRTEIEAFDPEVVVDNIAAFRSHAETVVAAFGERRYVVISSMDVYRAYGSLHAGTQTEPLPVDETSPVREERYPYRGQIEGMDDYDKLDVEETYLERSATVLRLPMVYGPRDPQRREELVLRRVRAGRDRIPVGSGNWLGVRGFVDDIARAVELVVRSHGLDGEVLNLGESRTYPVGLWVRMILEAAGHDAELVRVPDERLPADLAMTGSVAQHLLVDSSKARRRLDWTDSDPRDALARTVAWHLAHPPPEPDTDFTADDEALGAVP